MANPYINHLYRTIFEENFSNSEFSKQVKMQNAMYLLDEMGINAGNYVYFLYDNGMFSGALAMDMADVITKNNVILTNEVECIISQLKKALTVPANIGYTSAQWAACLGSLRHILKETKGKGAEDEILIKLRAREPQLNDSAANRVALSCINHLFLSRNIENGCAVAHD